MLESTTQSQVPARFGSTPLARIGNGKYAVIVPSRPICAVERLWLACILLLPVRNVMASHMTGPIRCPMTVPETGELEVVEVRVAQRPPSEASPRRFDLVESSMSNLYNPCPASDLWG